MDPSSGFKEGGKFINMDAIFASNAKTRRLLPLKEPLSKLMGITKINGGYPLVYEYWEQEGSFFRACLRALEVTYKVSADDMARIPQTGPVVVVSNHPFGGVDGIILGAILEEVRPDFRLLGNFLLETIDPVKPWIIPVNPFDSGKKTSENSRGLKACLQWLKKGGLLGTFPAGEVARYRFKQRAVLDPEWNRHAISLARRAGAEVVPIFFQGHNSFLFQSLGQLHPSIRTFMLPREMLNLMGREIPVSVGKPIPPSRLEKLDNDAARTRFVRLRTEILANRQPEKGAKMLAIPARTREMQEVIAPIDPELMAKEVEKIPDEDFIYRYKNFSVFLVEPDQIPKTLREIGRLRELSFRAEGEGAGKDCDLDEFDEYYRHLVMWDHDVKQVAGAYRVGMTDLILPKYGPSGLYTSTLFKFTDEFLDVLTPGLELGRSFIAPDYQKANRTLTILWRGLFSLSGIWPKYHFMFGPVSISNTYSMASKALITRYLQDGQDEDMLRAAAQIRPRRPFRHRRRIFGMEGDEVSGLLNGVEDVSALISEIEPDQKGIPTLLKHYLKMHTTLLSFNVDREFSNCLDGLIITDFQKTDRRFLSNFMTDELLDRLAAYVPKK